MRVSILVIFLGVMCASRSEKAESQTFLDKFLYGVELIHRLFSNGASSNFRTFFLGAFKTKQEDNFAENLLNAIVKTIGGNEEEIGMAGIRLSVLVAKMISDAFPQTGRSDRSVDKDFSPLDTILRQPQMKKLVRNLRDPNLIDKVLNELSVEEDAECMRLLVCKLSPFVRGMQRSLDFFIGQNETVEREIWFKSKPTERMYLFLPGMNEFLQNGDICDDGHPLCMY